MSQSLSPTSARRRPTTARGSVAGGAVVAVLLHAAIIAATLFTFQHKLEIVDETPPSVPVDLVTPIADKTNIMPTVAREPKPAEDVKPPEPKPQPVPTPTPPQPQADEEPTPVASEPVVPKPAPPPPRPLAKPMPATPAPVPAPAPKKKSDDIDALLNKLTAPAATPRNARPAARTQQGAGAMNAATADLRDALRSQIKPCWSPPVGAPRPEELVVDFDLLLNADGSVARPPQLTADSAARAASDPFTRAAAESARRAIYSCAPYKLPKDKYDQWSEIDPFHFDPRQMMGQ
ncbi:MAG: hypothetical protein WDM91_10240 [Rhizomicrobium sp.]